jgi:hypothetical protein
MSVPEQGNAGLERVRRLEHATCVTGTRPALTMGKPNSQQEF